MQKEYYLAVNGRQEGHSPLKISDIRNSQAIRLCGRVGLNDWVKASQLPELEGVVVIDIDPIDPNYNPGNDNSGNVPPHDEPVWFAMFGDNRVGPVSISRTHRQRSHATNAYLARRDERLGSGSDTQ